MVEPGVVITGVSTVASALKALDGLLEGQIKRTRGRKRSLLLEMRGNVRLIRLFIEGDPSLIDDANGGDQSLIDAVSDGDLPIVEVIERLEIKHLEAALESDFKFEKLKKGTVKKSATGGSPQLMTYVGWTTEELVSSIYLRIKDLKNIVEIAPDNKKFRKSVRLLNIAKLIGLLIRHIKS